MRKEIVWGSFALILVLVTGLACGPVEEPVAVGPPEVNYWEQRKGDCEQVLMAPQAYEVDRVTHCMKLWETYRSVGDLSLSMRSMYAIAFSMSWYSSEDQSNLYEKQIAEAALGRLCVPRHPMVNGQIQEKVPTKLVCNSAAVGDTGGPQADTVAMSTVNPEVERLADLRSSVPVKSVSDRSYKKAKALNKKGLRQHNKKAFGKAVDFYEQALSQHPYYVTAQYNLVCALALMGDDEGAMDALETLYSWDDSEVEARLIKAREDADLTALRDYTRFKQLTGYFRLTLANGAGDYGLESVARVKGELEARRFAIHQLVNTKKPVLAPQIWYKPEFENYVEKFKVILSARKITTHVIDYDTLEDVIIVWGQPEAANLYGQGVNAPVVQGVRAVDDSNGLEDFTNAVTETQGQVEGATDAGTGAVDAVPK